MQSMKKTIEVALCCCLLVFAVAAKPALLEDNKSKKDDKARVFDVSYDKVWDACIASASENFIIDHSEKDSGILSFHSGISFTSAGFSVGVTLKKLEDGNVRVQLNTQAKGLGNYGAGGRIAKKFFKGVEQYLKEGKAKV